MIQIHSIENLGDYEFEVTLSQYDTLPQFNFNTQTIIVYFYLDLNIDTQLFFESKAIREYRKLFIKK